MVGAFFVKSGGLIFIAPGILRPDDLFLKADAFKSLCGVSPPHHSAAFVKAALLNLYAGWGATLPPRLRFLAAKSGEKSRPEGFRSPQTPANGS